MDIVQSPTPAFESFDERFGNMQPTNAAVERLWTGGRWTEGPVWFGDLRCLLFSDIPNDRLLRWDAVTGKVRPFRTPSHFANGNTRDRMGRLVTCEHQARRVTRTEYDGSITVLLDRFEGKRLNAPNDVVAARDGSIWFTDPGYGILSDYEGGRAEFELPTRVYRVDAQTGRAEVVVEDVDRPNGLCFSPDERKLYVVDSGSGRNILVYDVKEPGAAGPWLRNGCVFCDVAPGGPDGIRTDEHGNLWAAAAWGGAENHGVHCFAPDGMRIGQIHLPELCANLTFGGPLKNRLFMTAGTSLYAVYVNTRGVQWP